MADVLNRPASEVADGATDAGEAPPPAPVLLADTGRLPVWVWAVPAAATFALCIAWIDRANLWQDELASVSAANRSFGDLLRLVSKVDAVLGVYYGFLHVWTGIFGTSPLSVRLPSALAMSVAAGLLAVLGARLGGRRVGLTAGLLFALLPAVGRYGEDARPGAIVIALAVGATLALAWALERPRWWRWLRYGLLVVAVGAVQVSGLVVLVPHAAVVVGVVVVAAPGGGFVRLRAAVASPLVRGFALVATVAVVVLAPLAVAGSGQRHQISWLPRPTLATLEGFPAGLVLSGAVAAGLGAVAALALVHPSRLWLVAAPWALLAPATAVLVSFLVVPITSERYLLWTLPAWVLLAAGATVDRRTSVALLVTVAVLAVPAQVQLHDVVWGGQPDYRAISSIMRGQVRPGDAFVVPERGGIRFRLGLQEYLPAQDLPEDVLARATPAAAGTSDAPQCAAAVCLGSPPRLWVGCWEDCPDPLSGLPAGTAAVIRKRGYRTLGFWHVRNAAIALLSRPTS